MSLVPVREYTSAEEMMAAYRARLRPKQPVVAIEMVTPLPPEPAPEEVAAGDEDPTPEEAEVIDLAAEAKRQTGREILRETCERHGVKLECVIGERRHRALVDCRREAAWLIARDTTLSLPQIGALLGKDHTTALMAIRRHNELTGANVRNLGFIPEKTRERNRASAVRARGQKQTFEQRMRESELHRIVEDYRL